VFLHRMAQAIEIEQPAVMDEPDRPDAVGSEERGAYDAALASDRDVIVYRISGAFFFGAAAAVGAALDRIGQHPKAYVIDFSGVPVIDSTAAATIEGFARKARRQGARLYLTGTRSPIRRVLLAHGLRPPLVRFRAQLGEAVEAARRETRSDVSGTSESR
jgi:SulP family sulfate permease